MCDTMVWGWGSCSGGDECSLVLLLLAVALLLVSVALEVLEQHEERLDVEEVKPVGKKKNKNRKQPCGRIAERVSTMGTSFSAGCRIVPWPGCSVAREHDATGTACGEARTERAEKTERGRDREGRVGIEAHQVMFAGNAQLQ